MKKILKDNFEKNENYDLQHKNFNSVKAKLKVKEKSKKIHMKAGYISLGIAGFLIAGIGVSAKIKSGIAEENRLNQASLAEADGQISYSNNADENKISPGPEEISSKVSIISIPEPDGDGEVPDTKLRGGDIHGQGCMATGHYFAYETEMEIAFSNEFIDITLFAGHLGIHTGWEGSYAGPLLWLDDNPGFDGDITKIWEEVAQLEYRIDLYKEGKSTPLANLPGYLTNDYRISIGLPDPVPEYVTPSDETIIYNRSIDVSLSTASVITSDHGEIRINMVQINKSKAHEIAFTGISIYYEIIEGNIRFSNMPRPTPYDKGGVSDWNIW